MSQKYKYTATFENIIFASDKIANSNISEASLDALEPLIPKGINFDRNIDLIGVAFNAAVVNKFNKNGDGIDSEAAVKIKDYFVHKPTNIEHNRDKIVGHIVSAGFSKYEDDSSLMSSEEALLSEGAYNIALGAVVYKTASKEFSDLVMNSTDKDSDFYHAVSASWEVGFNDYVIAIGSEDLSGSVIVSDKTEIEEYTPYLKSFGGKGSLSDGRTVSRLITGDIYPLGIGFTSNPAADVKGLIVNENNEDESPEKTQKRIEPIDKMISDSEKISQSPKEDVLNKEYNQNFTMDKDIIINEFRAALDEKLGKQDFSEEAIASISKVFSEAIKEKSDQYIADLDKAKAEKEEAANEQAALQEKMTEVESQLQATEEKLSALEEENATREAEVIFNNRMEALDEVYDLDDEDRQVVASELSALDTSDESFSAYQEKLAKIWKHKNKEYVQEQKAAFEAKVAEEVEKRLNQVEEKVAEATEEAVQEVSEASETIKESDESNQVEEALDNIEVEDAAVVNNNEASSDGETFKDRFAKTFKDSVNISF